MPKGMLLLVLALALLTARAVSQEIVIEPTNGRTPTATHAPHPAAIESAPATAPKPTALKPSATKAKPAPAKQTASKPKPAPVEAKPEAVETAKAEPAPAAAPRKVVPARPSWAMTDTRDARSLQIEIANALARDPKLAGSAIQVKVDDTSVTLEGRVAGTEERLQAQRLAQSYAWNRKLADRIEVVVRIAAQK